MEGHGGKGLVGQGGLRTAIRTDIQKCIHADHQQIPETNENLLRACFNPRRLLEFDALAALFARQSAPSQVLTEKAVTFSPARLQTFGLP